MSYRLAAFMAAILALATSGAWGAADVKIGNSSGVTEEKSYTKDFSTEGGFFALGWADGATGIATVDACKLTVGGNLIISHIAGSRGEMYLNSGIVDANSVNNTRTIVANNANTSGLLAIKKGTLTANREMSVGESGTGTMEVYEGGAVNAKGSLYVGKNGTGNGTLNLKGGTLTVAGDLNVANGTESVGSFNGTSGTLSLTGSGKVFNVGHGENSTGTVTKDGGDWTCYYLRLGNTTGATGTFMHNGGNLEIKTEFSIGLKATGTFSLDGGTVTVDSGKTTTLGKNTGASGALNLNGGTLVTKQVVSGSGSGVLNFNGGTLKANAVDGNGLIKSGVTVEVGANGGTIDSGNNAISIGAVLADASGAAGAMRFKGGNTIALNGDNAYTGGTTIELGTKVIAGTEAAKVAVLENGLVVDGRSVLNATDYTVFEFPAGDLTDDVINNVSYVNCADGTAAKVVGGTTIVVTLAEATCVPKTPNTLKIFENMTLDDIVYGKFSARMCGGYLGDAFDVRDAAKGYNKKMYYENGNLTSIIVEFQVRDGSNTKCVVVEFTEEGGSVYAKGLGSKYSTNAIGYEFYERNGTWYGSDPNSNSDNCYAETIAAAGYGVCDIRVEIEEATEWTLDQDRSWRDLRAGATLNGDSLVRIIVAGDSSTLTIDEDVNVAKIEFVNGLASGISTNALSVSDGVTVACGMVELGDNVCVKPIAFTPASVALLGGSSRLLYDTGESVCAAEVSGMGYIEVASGATLYVDGDVGAAYILNNGIVVKQGEGTVAWPFNNASEGVTVVNSGTLKIASHTGDGSNHTVRVKSGATFDMNGWGDTVVSVILEEGANFVNSRRNIGSDIRQAKSISLEGDATATVSKNFGLIGGGRTETTLALGSNTLTINGTSGFWLCNTTIVGDGIIAVNGATVQCVYSKLGNVIGENCTLNIGVGGTLRIDNDVSLTVKNFHNGGTYYVYSGYGLGTLVVTGTLTTGNKVTKLTLANGATIKATGTAQEVTTTFSASDTIYVNASEICDAVKSAEDQRIRVLTIPKTSYKDEFKSWDIVLKDGSMLRLRWFPDGDAKMALYVCRSSGTMIIVR